MGRNRPRRDAREETGEEHVRELAFRARDLSETLNQHPDVGVRLIETLFSGKNPSELTSELAHFHGQLLKYAEIYKRIDSE